MRAAAGWSEAALNTTMVAKLVRPACRALLVDDPLVGLCWPVMINFL
jgi:hypothetical protein